MSTFKYVEDWYEENKDFVAMSVVDDEGILTTANGKKKGTYLVSVKHMDKDILLPMYAGEAGADRGSSRCIADRIKEHLHRWLGKYTEYYTGISRQDLASGKVRFHLHIVGESDDVAVRKQMESITILEKQPYLQYGPYRKYPSDYDGLDLCIIPWNGTRRKAYWHCLRRKIREEGACGSREKKI